jgi:hypothetical protein
LVQAKEAATTMMRSSVQHMWCCADFLSLKRLRYLSVFKSVSIVQAFRLWSKSVRGAKRARCKAALSSSLFILNPVFQSALLQFSELCCTVAGKLLLQPVPEGPVSFKDFLESQEHHVGNCREELSKVADQSLLCVTQACKQSLVQLEKELAEVILLLLRLFQLSAYEWLQSDSCHCVPKRSSLQAGPKSHAFSHTLHMSVFMGLGILSPFAVQQEANHQAARGASCWQEVKGK